MKRFVAVGDNHGSLINQEDCKTFLDFCADFKPHHRIHLGDNWDFANIRKGVDPEEEIDDPQPDWDAGYLFLERFRPTVFLCGNHDYRVFRLVKDARGLVRKYARDGIKEILANFERLKCRFIPYDVEEGIYRLGDWSFMHGYSTGQNALTVHTTLVRGNVVIGHLHRNEMLPAKMIGGALGFCVGGLGDHKAMTYARHRPATTAWGKGWVYGHQDEKTGRLSVSPYFKLGNKWLK